MIALLFLLAAPAEPPPRLQLQYGILGWTHDGQQLGIERCYRLDELRYELTALSDREGKPLRIFRQSEADAPDPHLPDSFRGPFAKAEPEEALAAQLKAQPLDDRTQLETPSASGAELNIKGQSGELRVRVKTGAADGQGCAALSLEAARAGTAFVAILEQPCEPGDGAMKELEENVEMEWAPDGSRVAVAWNVSRNSSPPLRESRWRPALAVIPREKLVTIDLLDCGAGGKLAALHAALAARFTVSHQGKALKSRTRSVVYFAPGVEAEARAIAALLGNDPQILPLDFASPFAITVAAAN